MNKFLIISSILLIFSLPGNENFLIAQDKNKGVDIQTPDKNSSGTTRALIIGISHYKDIAQLNYAHTDAKNFYNYLISKAGGSIDPANMKFLTEENATAAQIVLGIKWLVNSSKEGDKAIIYFSGHGDVETVGNLHTGYLLSYDCNPQVYEAGGTIAVDRLQQYISACASAGTNVLLI